MCIFFCIPPSKRPVAVGLALVLMASRAAWALEDPTRPVAYDPGREAASSAEQWETQWVLTMVRLAPSGSMAVLNGQIVREGDVIGGSTVTAIAPEGVTLERNGRHLRVEFARRPVKMPHSRSNTGKGSGDE